MKDEFKIYLPNLSVTKNVAELLARQAKDGFFISLRGGLGTGKTTFTRYFINYFSQKKINVVSPTFPLLQIYNLKKFDIWHFDLYRLTKLSEIFPLDYEEALNNLVLIEWPELIEPLLPEKRIEIHFKEDSDKNLFMKIFFTGGLKLKMDL